MCFGADARPPVPSGARPTAMRSLVLEADDGNRLLACAASGEEPSPVAVVVLPDVRGLFPFYEQLAQRFSEAGYDAIAIDYFGRTAGLASRSDDFPFMDHVALMTHAGVKADVAAAVAHMRQHDPERAVFTVGFCLGGSNSWYQAANGHGLAGAIGFYGHPGRDFPPGAGSVIDQIGAMECPVVALQSGIDAGIPTELVEEFEAALGAGGVPHTVVVYPDAPHSFFDRAQAEYTTESEDAWRRILTFLEENAGF